MATDHPFASGVRNLDGGMTYYLDVDSRLRVVRRAEAAQLRAILALPDLQVTVRKAAAARLRRMQKDGAPA